MIDNIGIRDPYTNDDWELSLLVQGVDRECCVSASEIISLGKEPSLLVLECPCFGVKRSAKNQEFQCRRCAFNLSQRLLSAT